MESVEDGQLVGAGRRVLPEAGEALGAEVLEKRAPVNQERLAGHASELVLGSNGTPIAPWSSTSATRPSEFHDLGPEDEIGEVQAVERPELLEAVEAREQVGEGDGERTDRRLGWKHTFGLEFLGARTEQPGPLLAVQAHQGRPRTVQCSSTSATACSPARRWRTLRDRAGPLGRRPAARPDG